MTPVAPAGSVAGLLGIGIDIHAALGDADSFAGAVEIGLRRNPNRVQLLVSRLLGKHIPVPATAVLAAANTLGAAVRSACDGQVPVVVGFAETATALGHGVAAVCAPDGGAAPYLNTSRRPAPPGTQVVRFYEEHSHAIDQALALFDDADLRGGRPLVLVDDELTTGTTAVNAIRAIQRSWPREVYVLAALLDCRGQDRRAQVARAVAGLGATVLSVSLLDGRVRLPADAAARAAQYVAGLPAPGHRRRADPVPVTWHDVTLPAGVPTTAMHGWGRRRERAAMDAMSKLAASLPLARDARTLVLGDEEFMYLPQLLARALGDQVRTSTTTRTPAVSIDRPGYPLRTVLSFPSTEDGERPAYAYNVASSAHAEPGNAPGFDDIIVVTDATARSLVTPLVTELAACVAGSLQVITVHPGEPASLAGAGERRAAQ